jgi:hypothetical protein
LIIMLGQDSGLAGSKDLAKYVKGKIKPAVMSEDEQVVGKPLLVCEEMKTGRAFISDPSSFPLKKSI